MISEEKYNLLKEGINDVGIFKAVFMAGGPGSGKSAVAGKLGMQALGLKSVNSDTSFENGLKKANLSLKMPENEEEQRDAVRSHAKALTGKRQNLYVEGRLGLIIDSTAKNIKFIIHQKKLLEALGYETAMVFVNTELDTALQRNRDRTRSIPDKIVKDSHAVVRKNMGKLQGLFGRRNFYIIDNDGDLKDLEKNATKAYPRLQKFVSTLPKNKMVTAWKNALTMKPTSMKSVKDAMWGKGKHSTKSLSQMKLKALANIAAETDYSFKNFISEEAKHVTYEDYCFMLDCIEYDLDDTLTEEDKKTWWDKLSRDKQITYKKNNPKSDRKVKKEPDKKSHDSSPPEKRGAKHIFNSLKSHISDVTSETGVGVKKIVSSMKQKDVHGVMKAVGYSFETAGKLAYGALRTVDKAVGAGSEALHDTKPFQALKKGTMKVDEFLDEHPVLKKATGAVVAGAVLAQWYHMSFSGDFESDYDLSAVGGALAGTYGITELLSTPEGIKGMALLSIGVATGGMSMLWPGGKKGMMLAAAYSGAKKLGDTDTAQKIFSRMKEMKDSAKNRLKGKDENYINSNMGKLKTFREITEGENVDDAREKHATERERMKDRHERELERAREDDFKDSEDNRQQDESILKESMIDDFEIRFGKESDWKKADKLVQAYLRMHVPKHAKALLTKTYVHGPDPLMVAFGDTKKKLKPPVNLNKLYNSIRKLPSSRDKYWDSIPKNKEKDALGEGFFSRIAADIEDGMKANAIAKKYGVSMKQVQGWIKDYKSTPKLQKEAKDHRKDYDTFVKQYAQLNKATDVAAAKLKKITGKNTGAMGLTDPKVKASPAFKKAKADYEKASNLTKKFLKGVPKDFMRRNSKYGREEVQTEANAVSLSNPDAKKMVGMMQKYVNSKNDKEKQTLMKQINIYQKKLGLKVTEEITEISVDKATGRKKAKTWGRTTGGYGAKAAKKSKRAGSKGARRVAKQSLRQGDVSPEVEKTKEKIYKDLKKKRDYFEKEYGDRADDVMHGTAMNMAKKQHKLESATYTTELSKQLALEALNVSQRRAIGMRMRRQAKKIAKARLRAKKRRAPVKQLMKRAMKQARDKLAKKMTGGKSLNQMSVGQRVAISKKLDKKSAQIQKLAKKSLPKVKKDEMERLKRFKAKLADKSI